MGTLDRFRVDGKVAVVTGASRGIGAGCALALAEAGADVAVVSRSAESLEEVAAGIRALGRQALVLPVDVNDTDALASVAQQCVDELGGLDIVVNNAGGTMPRALLDTTPGYLERAFHFNVTTAFTLTKAAVEPMLARGGGSVVNISSAAGRMATRGGIAYGTAKAAMSHMTRLAAMDLAPRIRVNAIACGAIATSALEIVLTDDDLRTEMERSTPLRRIGDVEDVATTCLWLASPAGAYVTGKVIEVDGGIQAPNLDRPSPDL